tara:strand:+ start:674 stop:1042 length:369 start_codon:yes stop_codon:yes gene_type:complete
MNPMKKIYYLKTCTTCVRIIKTLKLSEDFILQDIKENPIGANDLDRLKKMTGSYEALFSRRAKLYKEMGLKDKVLGPKDFRFYILQHYTFLKRPIIVLNKRVFVGNNKSVIKAAIKALANEI